MILWVCHYERLLSQTRFVRSRVNIEILIISSFKKTRAQRMKLQMKKISFTTHVQQLQIYKTQANSETFTNLTRHTQHSTKITSKYRHHNQKCYGHGRTPAYSPVSASICVWVQTCIPQVTKWSCEEEESLSVCLSVLQLSRQP